MKKLKQGESVRTVSSRNEEVYQFLRSLKVGDTAVIDKEDWKTETPFPHTIHNSLTLRGRYSCKLLEDRSGWLVKRIK